MRKIFNNKTIEHIINVLFLLDLFFLVCIGLIVIYNNYPLLTMLLGIILIFGFLNFVDSLTYNKRIKNNENNKQ